MPFLQQLAGQLAKGAWNLIKNEPQTFTQHVGRELLLRSADHVITPVTDRVFDSVRDRWKERQLLKQYTYSTTLRIKDRKTETETVVEATHRIEKNYQIRDINGSEVIQGDTIVNNYNFAINMYISDLTQLENINSKLSKSVNELKDIGFVVDATEADAEHSHKLAQLQMRAQRIEKESDELALQSTQILSRSIDYPRLQQALGTSPAERP